MKNIYIYVFLLITGGFTACNRPPELPVVPSIEFENVEFREVEGPDSLIVSIYFQDGDGDLGLAPFETDEPYHPYDILKNGEDTIFIGSEPGLPEYNPIDYIILRDQDGEAKDTVLVELNENHYNFFIRFFTKRNGRYTEFNWRDAPYYQTFDGRFPILNTDTDGDNGLRNRPLEGSLKYGMTSSGWLFLFRDTMKVSIQIQDRALNKSNIVESPDFTLEQIRVTQ